MSSTNLIVQKVNSELQKQFADKETVHTLLTTTFKGMSEMTMKKSILEGMIRGFEFKNFLNKDVYAISFGNDYSLVTSIDYNRKVAAQNGLVGKSAPVYGMDNGDMTCSITVKRQVNGIVGEYTSLVYLSEYTTKKNQWLSKPRTMLAKVAEMHALRMAFPEELSKSYIEDESVQKNVIVQQDEEINLLSISNTFENAKTVEELNDAFRALSVREKANKEVVLLAKERKQFILDYDSNKVKDAEVEVPDNSSDGTAK
jgi:hypothetical protein